MQKEKLTVKEEYEIVKFNQDVPRFLGSDMREYGSFKKGDKAQIHEDQAKVIENRNAGIILTR